MIRHIVLFTLKGDKVAATAHLKAELEGLLGQVEGLRSLRVDADGSGIDFHWDAALVSEHDSWEALAAYQAHPEHRRILEEVVPLHAEQKAVVDHEL